MEKSFLDEVAKQLLKEQRELRHLIRENDEQFNAITDSRETELEEHAQEERDTRILERLDERQQIRLRDIDDALARIEAGTYGICANCQRAIAEERLRADLTTTLCLECSSAAEAPNEESDEVSDEP